MSTSDFTSNNVSHGISHAPKGVPGAYFACISEKIWKSINYLGNTLMKDVVKWCPVLKYENISCPCLSFVILKFKAVTYTKCTNLKSKFVKIYIFLYIHIHNHFPDGKSKFLDIRGKRIKLANFGNVLHGYLSCFCI